MTGSCRISAAASFMLRFGPCEAGRAAGNSIESGAMEVGYNPPPKGGGLYYRVRAPLDHASGGDPGIAPQTCPWCPGVLIPVVLRHLIDKFRCAKFIEL